MEQKRPADILKAAAANLQKARSTMSLRAVAKRLEISPSYWSKILKGEKPLPNHLIPKVVAVLGLDTQQTADLQRSILELLEQEALTPATGLRVGSNLEKSPTADYKNLGREEFWLLQEWYYIPILNLFTVSDFERTPEATAQRMGLRLDQAENALVRLKERGFLSSKEDSTLERTDLQIRFPTDRSHADVRKYHQSMIKGALSELNRSDAADRFDLRLISAVCFAGDSTQLKEARLILEEAMFKAANLMASAPASDEVYQLNIQIFPLTNNKKEL